VGDLINTTTIPAPKEAGPLVVAAVKEVCHVIHGQRMNGGAISSGRNSCRLLPPRGHPFGQGFSRTLQFMVPAFFSPMPGVGHWPVPQVSAAGAAPGRAPMSRSSAERWV